MIFIKSDGNNSIDREIAEKIINKSNLREWYTEEHIENTLNTSPFVLIEMAWDYDILEAFVEVSKEYPNIFFTISNNVPNALEQWVRYIKDGKTQIRLPRVVIDGCNPKEFKTLEEERELMFNEKKEEESNEW